MKVRITREILLWKDIEIPDELWKQAEEDETGDVYNEDVSRKYWPLDTMAPTATEWTLRDEFSEVIK